MKIITIILLLTLFSPALASTAAPDIPAVLGAMGVSAHQINVSWSPSLGSVQPSKYNIYRNGQLVGSIPGIPNNVYKDPGLFQDVGLNPSTSYTYTVTSVSNSNEESAASMSVTAATLPATQSGIIPPNRLYNWIPGITVGVPGGIPTNRMHLIDITQPPYNADKTGANDASGAINSALANSAAQDVIYLPAGRYKLLSTIYATAANRTLRGAGMNSTIIDCRVSSICVFLRGGDGFYNAPTNQIVSGLSKGSTQLTVANGSLFQNGSIVQVTTDDRTLPVLVLNNGLSSNGFYIRGQNSRVTAKSGNTLTIDPPLMFNSFGLNTRLLVAPVTLRGFGVEDLTIDGSNALPQVGILMLGNYGSWVKNVKIKGIGNYSLSIGDSLACEVRHSYLDELNHSGSNGAGLLMGQTGNCLVEDNIIYKSFPLLEINTHSTGNVFAYNFMTGSVVDTNHGPHNSYNLYEGNLMDGIISDAYFGSESEGTFFRNWMTGKVFPVALKRFSRNFSIVGNQIGETGGSQGLYSFGQPNIGNGNSTGFVAPSGEVYWADWNKSPNPGPAGWQERDLDVLTTTILKVNWYSGVSGYRGGVNESLQAGETLPPSLYLTSKPPWFGNLAWPPFSPTAPNQSYDAIPAAYRYNHGIDPLETRRPVPNASTNLRTQ